MSNGLGVAFQQPLAFQFPAFQGQDNPAADFAYAEITVNSQAAIQPAVPTFLSGSRCRVTIAYFDTTSSPMVPVSVQWRLEDIPSGEVVVPWTPIDRPGLTNIVQIQSTANAFISFSLPSERRKIVFSIVDTSGVTYLARAYYDLDPEGGLYVTSFAFQGQGAFQSVAFQTGNSPANN